MRNNSIYQNIKDLIDRGDISELKKILEQDLDPLTDIISTIDDKDKHGNTILMYAVQKGNKKIVSLLLELGADPNLQNADGDTALTYAEKGKHKEIISMLKPITELRNEDMVKKVDGMIVKAAQDRILNYRDQYGRNYLMVSALKGDNKGVSDSLELGIDVHAKDINGATALMYAAYSGDKTITEKLLGAGAEIDARNKFAHTPLMFASENGKMEVIELLIERGANPNHVDAKGRKAIDFAEMKGHNNVAEILKKNQDLNDQSFDNSKKTNPLLESQITDAKKVAVSSAKRAPLKDQDLNRGRN